MANKQTTKKIINQFTPTRTNLASVGGTSLEIPNHSRGKAPEADRGLANKQYVDGKLVESFPTSLITGSIPFSDGTNLNEDNDNLFWDDTNNRLGVGTNSPVTCLHINDEVDGATNTATFENRSAVNTAQVRVQFLRGQDAGIGFNRGMVMFTTRINSGWANYEGKALAFYTGTVAGTSTEKFRIQGNGNVGVGTNDPTQPLSVKEKVSMTAIGGIAIKLTNKTGANSVAGKLVRADTANNDAVILTASGDIECFGVFLDDGVTDGSEAWVVVSGIADVLMDDNLAATRGNWVGTGIAAGKATNSASPPAAPTHFEEIGHCIETVAAGGAGTNILARCVLHFN